MRFVFVLTNLRGGGAEKAILKVAKGLLDRQHQVSLYLFESRCDYEIPAGLEIVLAAPGKTSVSKGWLAKRLLAFRLARHVARVRPDLVVSTLPFADEVAMLAGLPAHWCRIANTLSAEIESLAADNPAKAARRAARYRQVYGQSPLIAVSTGVAADMRASLGVSTRIEHIPNPFDADAIRQAAQQAVNGLPDAPYVLHIGRFSAQKRHDVLLDAWQQLDVPHRLVLLTHPDPALEQMIVERSLQARVSVAGFQQNPYPWMAAAALLVLSSDREGLPNVLIEALLCGTPVVSTDCPSGPAEILGRDLPGALVPCGDPQRLAAAIRQSLENPPDVSGVDLSRYAEPAVIDAYEALAAERGKR